MSNLISTCAECWTVVTVAVSDTRHSRSEDKASVYETTHSDIRCVFQELPEPNRACLVGVWWSRDLVYRKLPESDSGSVW